MLGPDLGGVPVDVPRERLLAVVDDLHRPVGVEREHRGVDLDREVLAATEGPADSREMNADLLGRERQAGRDLVAVDVQPLRRDMDVDPALAVRDGEPRLGAEERLVLAAELVHPLDRDVALDVRVAVPDHDRPHDVRARVVAVAVAHRRAVGVDTAPARSPARDRRRARAARTPPRSPRPPAGPARDAPPRRARRARRSSGHGRSRARVGRGTRARRSVGRERPRA